MMNRMFLEKINYCLSPPVIILLMLHMNVSVPVRLLKWHIIHLQSFFRVLSLIWHLLAGSIDMIAASKVICSFLLQQLSDLLLQVVDATKILAERRNVGKVLLSVKTTNSQWVVMCHILYIRVINFFILVWGSLRNGNIYLHICTVKTTS